MKETHKVPSVKAQIFLRLFFFFFFFFPWLDSYLEMTPIFNWALFSWGVGRGGLVLILYGTFDKLGDVSEDYSTVTISQTVIVSCLVIM